MPSSKQPKQNPNRSNPKRRDNNKPLPSKSSNNKPVDPQSYEPTGQMPRSGGMRGEGVE